MKIINENATGKEILHKDEYFALMVMDLENKTMRTEKDYLNFSKGWIGFECTSEKEIYISKNFNERNKSLRGDVFIVKIEKGDKTCLLS